MNTSLIDQLTNDLSPVKALNNKMLFAFFALGTVLSVASVLSIYGLRFDYNAAIETGAMFWKPAIFLFASLGGLMIMSSLSRPHGTINKAPLGFIALSFALIAWQTVSQFPNISLDQISQGLQSSSAVSCLSVTLIGGALLTVASHFVWLRKTASSRPVLLGAISGFTAASLAAASYALYCSKDMILYVTTFYGFGILVMTLIGAVLGKKFLNW